MLEWLRARRTPVSRAPVVARTPAGTRLYAIGDIHGRADLLDRLLGLIARDAARHTDKAGALIFLGDYVDRGPWSAEVLERLSTGALPLRERHFLMGNHEQMLLGFLHSPLEHARWLEYGGLATLASYAAPLAGRDADTLVDAAATLAAALPAHHRRFLEGLAYSHCRGGYLFAHAGIRPGVPIAAQEPHDLLWIREPFLRYRKPHPLTIVHGHHALEKIDARDNRIGIDTGAYATGRLSCLVLDGAERLVLDTEAGEPVPLSG